MHPKQRMPSDGWHVIEEPSEVEVKAEEPEEDSRLLLLQQGRPAATLIRRSLASLVAEP